MKSVATLLSLSLLTVPLVAQERVGRHALIIGVSQYQNPAASPLKGVPYDVISAGKIVDAMGVPRSNPIVLQDDKADKASIIRELDGLAKRVAPGDRVLVYFSGHGTRWPDVQAKRDGFLYIVLLGSDRESLCLLYPNGYDSNNQIKANKAMTLPTPGWSVEAGGPAGKDELLVLASDSPRDLKARSLSEPTSEAPFTYALTDLGSRPALIDFLTGRGVQGRSEGLVAAIFSVVEYEGSK